MRSHKLRCALSMLGVLLGVASLVAMLTLIGGIDQFLNVKMGKWIGSIWFSQKGNPSDGQDKLVWSRSPGLRFSDGGYLEDNSQYVKDVTSEISRRQQFSVAGVRQWGNIRGITPQSIEKDLEHIEIDQGRWPSPEDYRDGRRVCVLSWEIRDQVQNQRSGGNENKPRLDLVGEDLAFQSVPFTVVGVYRPIDPDFAPWNLRRAVFVPLEAMRKYVTGLDPSPGTFEVAVADVKKTKEQSILIARTMTERHRGVEDFEYRSAEWLENMTKMLNNISLLMSVISVISLLVGGLNIMNVMLSSIAERIREIGIRKALGAKNGQLFIQFIAETTTLSFVGGIMGGFLGLVPLAFGEAIQKSTDGAIAPTILPGHAILVFCVIVIVGVVFGLYPAVKAMRMNPVDALRYE